MIYDTGALGFYLARDSVAYFQGYKWNCPLCSSPGWWLLDEACIAELYARLSILQKEKK